MESSLTERLWIVSEFSCSTIIPYAAIDSDPFTFDRIKNSALLSIMRKICVLCSYQELHAKLSHAVCDI